MVATHRLTPHYAKCKLITVEVQYYKAAAEYQLIKEGIQEPSEKQIKEETKRLSHIYPGFSILLAPPLSEREIEVIVQASCGEELKESAAALGISTDVVKKYRISAFRKLQSKNISEAVHRAWQLNYLPLKDKKKIMQPLAIEESE
jgi:DNA-binding NarL/FixJ family response regulator